jgi:hypothetical protein
VTTANLIAKPKLRTRHDHVFFQAISALIAIVVFVGFAQTYYLPGYLSGALTLPAWKQGLVPPHPWIVHIHAVLFSSWIGILLLQASLVFMRRVDLHRKLGVATIALAALMLLVGFAVSCESLARNFAPADPRLGFAATNVLALMVFSTLVYFAYRERFNPAAHKRLMMVATIQLLPAAIVRLPVPGIAGSPPTPEICCYPLLLLMAGYDLWTMRNVHSATLWGLIGLGLPFNDIIFQGTYWRYFAMWMQTIGYSLR